MRISIDTNDLEISPEAAVAMLTIGIVILIIAVWYAVHKISEQKNDITKDDGETTHTEKVKILERLPSETKQTWTEVLTIEWYLIEREDGNVSKMRAFSKDNIILPIGDIGFLRYKGETIQSFQREQVFEDTAPYVDPVANQNATEVATPNKTVSFCTNCGSPVKADATFCGKCGCRL